MPKTVTTPSLDRNITILQRPDDGRDLPGDHKIFKILNSLPIKMECRARPAQISWRRHETGHGAGRRCAEQREFVSGNDLPVRINLLRLNTLAAFENCVTVMAGATLGSD